MKAWIKRNYYRIALSRKNVFIQENVLLNTKNKFEGLNFIGKNCEVASCFLGRGTYISDSSTIKNARIGRFCSIGSNVQTLLGLHPTDTFVSTHPAFFSEQPAAGFTFAKTTIFEQHKFIDTERQFVVDIGNDVWIGNNVIIMDGVKIADGAIIAAGAIVTKDVEPYAIVGGIPAKLIRYRFKPSQIAGLLNTKWWDWDIEIIKSKAGLFNNIESFLARINDDETHLTNQ